jgi:hypothetical protein
MVGMVEDSENDESRSLNIETPRKQSPPPITFDESGSATESESESESPVVVIPTSRYKRILKRLSISTSPSRLLEMDEEEAAASTSTTRPRPSSSKDTATEVSDSETERRKKIKRKGKEKMQDTREEYVSSATPSIAQSESDYLNSNARIAPSKPKRKSKKKDEYIPGMPDYSSMELAELKVTSTFFGL